MSIRDSRRTAVALAIAAILIGGGYTALLTTAPARAAGALNVDASGSVQVTAESGFSFSPNNFNQVPTNSTITVTFTDNDALDHTFTIIGRQGWVIPSGISEDQFDSLVFGSSPRVLFNANASAVGNSGDQVTLTFTSPGVGWYEFVCTQAGHFQNGMYGFIAFGENLPANLTVVAASTNPGTAVFIIVGTIVALVVIAIVLGFVVGRRRGAAYEMPPQRLGYAEPEAPEPSSSSPLPQEPRG
jgi:plastocyanin